MWRSLSPLRLIVSCCRRVTPAPFCMRLGRRPACWRTTTFSRSGRSPQTSRGTPRRSGRISNSWIWYLEIFDTCMKFVTNKMARGLPCSKFHSIIGGLETYVKLGYLYPWKHAKYLFVCLFFSLTFYNFQRLNFIDVATGSLGQGFSCAAGMAYVGKYVDKASYRVYCLMGDGEIAEGSVWEAAGKKCSNFLNSEIIFFLKIEKVLFCRKYFLKFSYSWGMGKLE